MTPIPESAVTEIAAALSRGVEKPTVSRETLSAVQRALAKTDVVAAVRRSEAHPGMYWLARRATDGAHVGQAGMWEYPGGKVEEGEQLREALVRELTEEFGDVRPKVGAVLDCIEWGRYRVTFFEVGMLDPVELRCHTEVRWMTPREACEVEHLPSGTIFNARHLEAFPADAITSEDVDFATRLMCDSYLDARTRVKVWEHYGRTVGRDLPPSYDLEEPLTGGGRGEDGPRECGHGLRSVRERVGQPSVEGQGPRGCAPHVPPCRCRRVCRAAQPPRDA